ncbi:hypothetical protein [Fibrobacter sp.]|uniref:hypothetical protein n=1 Tax=Fibrobacter sp. TaxID=35828 RepID=UPI002616218D|nr:hypothetical protein [Fibrobacter sp.]MDD5942470.1 hypothetical protein [Fibrobacter sp.]
MNKVSKTLSAVVVAAAAFGLIACDDSSSSPAAPNTDAQEQQKQEERAPSSSETVQPPVSSESNQPPESSENKAEGLSSSDETVASSSSETPISSSDVEICPPGSDCDGDGIPDGIYRPDLEPCDTDTLLEFYGRHYQCVSNKWVYLPAPVPGKIVEEATDVSAMYRGGPAVAPRVVKVLNSDGSVTFRHDDVLVNDDCMFNGVKAELSNDTLYAALQFPGCSETGGSMGVATFTLSEAFAGAKYIKYEDGMYVHEIYETDELLPCGNTSSCQTCAEGLDCGGRVF